MNLGGHLVQTIEFLFRHGAKGYPKRGFISNSVAKQANYVTSSQFLIAELVEHCIGIAEFVGSNPLQA